MKYLIGLLVALCFVGCSTVEEQRVYVTIENRTGTEINCRLTAGLLSRNLKVERFSSQEFWAPEWLMPKRFRVVVLKTQD